MTCLRRAHLTLDDGNDPFVGVTQKVGRQTGGLEEDLKT
jgi:hypothetical protein